MSGGEISGNEASDGGGVSVLGGTFEMSGGKISGNTGSNGGGGVYMGNGTFEMSGGEISGNSAMRGGGVFVYDGTFTKGTNGIIYGSNADAALKNTATAGDDYGHAAYLEPNGKKRTATAGVGVTLNSGTKSNWEK